MKKISQVFIMYKLLKIIYILTEYADGFWFKCSAIDEITFEPQDSHQSELTLDDYKFDEVIINNGNIEMLIEKTKQVLIKHKIL